MAVPAGHNRSMVPNLSGVRSGERHGIYELLETVAAMSERLFRDPSFDELYERYQDDLEGIPGFWQLAVNLASAFETLPRVYKVKWGETHDYILSVEQTVARLVDRALYEKVDLHDGRLLSSFVTLVPAR